MLENIRLGHIQAGAIAAIGIAGMAAFYPPALLFMAGAGISSIAGYGLLKNLPKTNSDKIKEVFEAVNYRNKNGKYPIKVNKSDKHLIYELPPGRSPEEFETLQPFINSHLKAETDIYVDNGQVHIRVLSENLPSMLQYTGEKPPHYMVLPIPIGQTREGFLWVDLTTIPHICVAGETYGGKTTWIMGALSSLVKLAHVRLNIFDLKQVDYSFIEDHSAQALTLPDAVKMAEDLVFEMTKRMKAFRKEKVPNIKRYNALMRARGQEELPYIVLIIDELTQLSPVLAKDKAIKQMRTQVTQNLVDILCLARAIGIHCIVSTQRPDRETLHPQMKANMPGAICFKTKNKINSQIVLDNTKADRLPRVRGRAIWQFDVEREVQVQFLDDEMIKKMLPKVPITKPVHQEILTDGRM